MKSIASFIVVIACFLLSNLLLSQTVSDSRATKETKALFQNLWKLQTEKTIFGQQDALAYGVGWKEEKGAQSIKSDLYLVTGEQPGIYGWDIAHLELDSSKNIDGVPFSRMKEYIREGYRRGSVITLSWHARNPLTGGSAWDTTPGSLSSILPGGSKHERFKLWLDKAALFLKDLKGKDGEPIPILFRPFHELTGNWFWWCQNVCSPDEFKACWQFTVHYLREKKGLHQLLFVYNTAQFKTEASFLERYPGDAYVDLLSFDQYQYGIDTWSSPQFVSTVQQQLKILSSISSQRKKPQALAETGLESVADPNWWTGSLMHALASYPVAYVVVWRNHGFMKSTGKMHYYGPYPGQISVPDFLDFTKSPRIILENGTRKNSLYQ